MFLLLAGSTEMARALIVDEFLGGNNDWRHLALEDIQPTENTEGEEEDIFGIQTTFMTMVACECAKEAHDAGNHVIITCPENEMMEGIYSELDEPIVSVFLGAKEDADGFNHIIDSASKSIVEIQQTLEDIIQTEPV